MIHIIEILLNYFRRFILQIVFSIVKNIFFLLNRSLNRVFENIRTVFIYLSFENRYHLNQNSYVLKILCNDLRIQYTCYDIRLVSVHLSSKDRYQLEFLAATNYVTSFCSWDARYAVAN